MTATCISTLGPLNFGPADPPAGGLKADRTEGGIGRKEGLHQGGEAGFVFMRLGKLGPMI